MKDPDSSQETPSAPTPATQMLGTIGVPYALHSYSVGVDAGDTTAGFEAIQEQLHVDLKRVFRAVVARVDEQPFVAVLPIDTELDTRALAAAVGGRSAVAAEEDVARDITGYGPAEMSPLGLREPLTTVIDDTCLRFPSVLISSGHPGLMLEIMPQRLIDVTNARLAPIGS